MKGFKKSMENNMESKLKSKLMLIDGNSILNRAFYGLNGKNILATSDGIYTNAILGFLNMLNKYLNEEKPFDKINPTAENIAKYIYRRIKLKVKSKKLKVIEVDVWETEKNFAKYYEE